MLTSVNLAESLPLTSKEHNQSLTDFVTRDQRRNKTHYRENLETQEGDLLDAICTRASDENKTILKDRNLETTRVVMDPN